MLTGLKQWWSNFINKLEKSNKEQFGNNRNLDCCDLNSEKDTNADRR